MEKKTNKKPTKKITKKGVSAPISLWNPDPEKLNVRYDGKLFICDFKNILIGKELDPYANFMINKVSYEKQLHLIVRYINFFMEFYDTENELALAYVKLKFSIDNERMFSIPQNATKKQIDESINGFIDYLYIILFDEDSHIAENIKKLVEDNYVDDIEEDGSRRNNGKEHLESLEFTNDHIKLLLSISFGIKIISPIMLHYFYINMIKMEKNTGYIYRFYKPLFDRVFNDGKTNMFNKLYIYVKHKVLESGKINSLIYKKREISGVDIFSVISDFVKRVIISENMVKYSFPENWDPKINKYKENIVGFQKTILKFQLNYFIKEIHEKNLSEVDTDKNSDGLSGADKMEMNIQKINEGNMALAETNADLTCKQIKTILDIPVTQEEVNYMKDYFKPSKIQIKLIYTFFAHYFGNYRDTKLVTKNNFHYLALLLKKKLLIESGWDDKTNDTALIAVLPYVLTGNLEGKLNSRIIRNNKYMASLDEDVSYQRLCKEYSLLLQIHPDELKTIISTFVNSQFSYVTPENPSLLGEIIEYDEHKIGSELIYFLYDMGKNKY